MSNKPQGFGSFLPTGYGVSISFHADGLDFLGAGSTLAEIGGSSVVVQAANKHSASHFRDMYG